VGQCQQRVISGVRKFINESYNGSPNFWEEVMGWVIPPCPVGGGKVGDGEGVKCDEGMVS